MIGNVVRIAAADRALRTSAAELAAAVAIVNREYPPGHLYRYGTNTTPGTTDMATALAAAFSVSATHPAIIPDEVQLSGSALTVPAQGQVYGYGRNSVIKKGFNGDLINLGAQGQLKDLYLDCDGGTRTGRGVVIDSGALDEVSWRRLTRVSIINSASYCVEFTQATAGYGSMLEACRMTTTDQVVEAVKCPDTEANNGNRFMIGCWTFGTPLAHFGGCDNMTLIGCQGAYPTFGTASKKVSIVGGRIVNNGPASRTNWTIQGTSHTIVGIVSGVGTLTFNTSLFKCTFRGNSLASGTVIADTARGVVDGNELDLPHTTFVPTWSGSVTNPAIGNGTLNGAWRRVGDYCRAQVKMIAGTTTTFGSGIYGFTVPYTASRRTVGAAYMLDSGTAYFVGAAWIEQGTNVVQVISNNAGNFVGAAIPFTWANGDTLVADIEFPIT